eukprot:1914339-Rhodomonas_salina.2
MALNCACSWLAGSFGRLPSCKSSSFLSASSPACLSDRSPPSAKYHPSLMIIRLHDAKNVAQHCYMPKHALYAVLPSWCDVPSSSRRVCSNLARHARA